MIRQISRFFDTPFVDIKPNKRVTITCLRLANNISTINARKKRKYVLIKNTEIIVAIR